MTIATNQTILGDEVGDIFNDELTALRDRNVAKNLIAYQYNMFWRDPIAAVTTAQIIAQTREFTPSTDIYLKDMFLEVEGNANTWTITVTGATLISPITWTSVAGASNHYNSYFYTLQNNLKTVPWITLFAGDTYSFFISRDNSVPTTHYVKLTLSAFTGVRR